MRCISPLHITWDGRNDIVPCGKCNFCLESRRAQWSFRIAQEMKVSSSADFLTLTYADENLPWGASDPTLVKSDFQLFMKKLRKAAGKSRLRYYAVGEYGTELGRPHYHIILFNMPQALHKQLDSIWNKGFVYPGEVEPASIHYVTGYVINRVGEYQGREPPFATMSRGGRKGRGLGYDYLTPQMKKYHVLNRINYSTVNGIKGSLPRYYKEKIFAKELRAEMSNEAAWDAILKNREELASLSKFHSDPDYYYGLRIRQAHDKIKTSKQKM